MRQDKHKPVHEKIRLFDEQRAKAFQAYQQAKAHGHKGNFRTFFAEQVGVSETTIHRIEGLKKLSARVVSAMDARKIPATFGESLAAYPHAWQDEVLDALESGKIREKRAVKAFLRKLHPPAASEAKGKAAELPPPMPEAEPIPESAPISEHPLPPLDFTFAVHEFPITDSTTALAVKEWVLVQTKGFYDALSAFAEEHKATLLAAHRLEDAARWDACLHELATQRFLLASRFPRKDDDAL